MGINIVAHIFAGTHEIIFFCRNKDCKNILIRNNMACFISWFQLVIGKSRFRFIMLTKTNSKLKISRPDQIVGKEIIRYFKKCLFFGNFVCSIGCQNKETIQFLRFFSLNLDRLGLGQNTGFCRSLASIVAIC